MATAAERLLTAEEFGLLPDDGLPSELVRGKIVSRPMATPRHGQICSNVAGLLWKHVHKWDLGHLANLSGVITQRRPRHRARSRRVLL